MRFAEKRSIIQSVNHASRAYFRSVFRTFKAVFFEQRNGQGKSGKMTPSHKEKINDILLVLIYSRSQMFSRYDEIPEH